MRSGRLAASFTIEASAVMAVVLIVMMLLLGQAFRLRGETVGFFTLHWQVERERHEIERRNEGRISRQAVGNGWRLEITAPVFRPEDSMRLWSLAEE